MTRPALDITTAIIDARDACQRSAGERYAEQVLPWRELITGLEQARGWMLMEVVYHLVGELGIVGKSPIWVLAAAHDEIMDRTRRKAVGA